MKTKLTKTVDMWVRDHPKLTSETSFLTLIMISKGSDKITATFEVED